LCEKNSCPFLQIHSAIILPILFSMRMTGQKTEYSKLDGIDKKVLSWTLKNSPASIPSWIEHTVRSYQNLKGIKINGVILLDEVKNNRLETPANES